MKKFFTLVGILILLFLVSTGAIVASAAFGQAQKCPAAPGKTRSENELVRLIETKGLILTDAEATALVQKPLTGKVEDARVCFTPGLAHLSGNFKLGKFKPSFYLSTAVDFSGPSPKAQNLDIRLRSLPNIFLFSPIERMVEGIINDNLAKAKFEEKFAIEFTNGSATIKKVK